MSSNREDPDQRRSLVRVFAVRTYAAEMKDFRKKNQLKGLLLKLGSSK